MSLGEFTTVTGKLNMLILKSNRYFHINILRMVQG